MNVPDRSRWAVAADDGGKGARSPTLIRWHLSRSRQAASAPWGWQSLNLRRPKGAWGERGHQEERLPLYKILELFPAASPVGRSCTRDHYYPSRDPFGVHLDRESVSPI